MKATRTRHGRVHMFITHRPTLTLQLHNFDLFRTCRTSSFCTVAWQLARFQLTQRIARSLGDSAASCLCQWLPCQISLRATRCEHCRAYLITTETMEPLDIDDKLDYAASTFLDAVHRNRLYLFVCDALLESVWRDQVISCLFTTVSPCIQSPGTVL